MTYIFAYMSSIQVPYKFLPYGWAGREIIKGGHGSYDTEF